MSLVKLSPQEWKVKLSHLRFIHPHPQISNRKVLKTVERMFLGGFEEIGQYFSATNGLLSQ